ncbi:MAG TPA: BTAD domain-containing putative transcriptional regulator [Acidimicrobiales bacterium]|nr:BTAD domain-containing putative transcriptional regulator [Acidimicrobiales bacterium]
MEFRILGSFEVVGTTGPIDVQGAKRRGLLACLVVHAGQPISKDRLVEELWGDARSDGAARTVQTYISQLRRRLRDESARLETRPGGYLLDIKAGDVDAYRFEQALNAVPTEAEPARRLAVLDRALELWRGPPLREFAGASWADREATRLEARHVQALQNRYHALMELDRAPEAAGELELLVTAHPLDERLWAQLILALYRSGRQADALGAYQRARRHLIDELGIDPGPELTRLEHRILDHDPDLLVGADDRASGDEHEKLADSPTDRWSPRTFLLTDIVDSVSLWERDPEAMSTAVARHDALVRDAVNGSGGELVRTKGEGDSTFSVFAHPEGALAAAAATMEKLAGEPWPPTTPLRVRIGVHTGDAEARDGDWYGQAVNRAARLRAVAKGGQTLVSGVTAGLVADRPPKGVGLLYRGRRALRGIERPEEVWELVGADDGRLAVVSSAAAGGLPVALTRFVGRATEVEQLVTLLGTERLITLTGPGGSGKSRLALELARNAAGRGEDVWLAELAPLRDGDSVAHAVASAVGVEPGPDPLHDLLARPEALAGLLVLDNCEHLIDACAMIVRSLLAAAADLRVLATSREPLGVAGEREWPVGPLDVPGGSVADRAQLRGVESVELLLDRARAVRPGLGVRDEDVASVVDICHRLDGVPLAIELAAGRLRSLSFADLAARLGDQLGLLAGHRSAGGDDRHRTLRMTFDWSYELLTDDQQRLAQRLSVFAGGFRLDAVEAVCGSEFDVLDGIDELVAKSLVTFDGVTARYRLLEPLRQYLAERLDEVGATESAQRAHAAWVVDLAEAAARGFFADQAAWARRLRADGPNIRAALVGAINRGDGGTALRISAAMGYPWFTMGQPDVRGLLDRTLAVAGRVDDRLRARALVAAAMLAQDASEYDAAEQQLEEALGLFQRCGSRRGRAWSLTWLARRRVMGADRGEPSEADTACAQLEEALALFRETQDAPGIAWSLAFLATRRIADGDFEGARAQAEEALAAAREAGASQPTGEALRLLGWIAIHEGEPDEARLHMERAAAIHRLGGDRWQEAVAASAAASAAALAGDTAAALDHYTRAVALVDGLTSSDPLAVLLQGFVPFLWALGRQREAAQLLGAYDAIRSYYSSDDMREVAQHVTESRVESLRLQGRGLAFGDVIALMRRTVDEVRGGVEAATQTNSEGTF